MKFEGGGTIKGFVTMWNNWYLREFVTLAALFVAIGFAYWMYTQLWVTLDSSLNKYCCKSSDGQKSASKCTEAEQFKTECKPFKLKKANIQFMYSNHYPRSKLINICLLVLFGLAYLLGFLALKPQVTYRLGANVAALISCVSAAVVGVIVILNISQMYGPRGFQNITQSVCGTVDYDTSGCKKDLNNADLYAWVGGLLAAASVFIAVTGVIFILLGMFISSFSLPSTSIMTLKQAAKSPTPAPAAPAPAAASK